MAYLSGNVTFAKRFCTCPKNEMAWCVKTNGDDSQPNLMVWCKICGIEFHTPCDLWKMGVNFKDPRPLKPPPKVPTDSEVSETLSYVKTFFALFKRGAL